MMETLIILSFFIVSLLTMGGKSFNRQALPAALLFVVVALQLSSTGCHALELEPILEYHFHTYFNANDKVQVAQAIELRNEIIRNCVSKNIVAVPLHYHYDPQNPALERK